MRAHVLLLALGLATMTIAFAAPTATAACVTDLSCVAPACTAGFPYACVDPAACGAGELERCVDLTYECLTSTQCGPPP